MKKLTPEGAAARREYYREYRARNREKLNAQRRAWYARNRDKVDEQRARYWERKGAATPEDSAE